MSQSFDEWYASRFQGTAKLGGQIRTFLRTAWDAGQFADRTADDGEAVTPEWLRAIGFYQGKFPDDLIAGPIIRGVVRNPFSKDNGKAYWAVRTYPIPDEAVPMTKGQVRRLCTALGVKLNRGPAD